MQQLIDTRGAALRCAVLCGAVQRRAVPDSAGRVSWTFASFIRGLLWRGQDATAWLQSELSRVEAVRLSVKKLQCEC